MNSLNKLIELNNIKKSFDGNLILKNISIEVYKNEFVTILGPSGCGKSTIFNIISGLIHFDKGNLNVSGSIGYMQQKDLLLPWKTIYENVSLPLVLKEINRKEIKKQVNNYMPIVGLKGYEDKYPSQLSGGMRQRANFLRTLLTAEDIMLLDEPFASLDSITKSSMHEWLLEVKSKLDNTILLITHDIDEAILLSDRIYILSDKPSYILKEFSVNFNNDNKLLRRSNDKSFKLKKEILKLL